MPTVFIAEPHDATKNVMQISKVPLVLIALSMICSCIAVGMSSWQGGNIFDWDDHHWSDLCAAVGALIVFGAICLTLAFGLGVYWTIYADMGGYMLLCFYIGLYLGAISLTIATLVYTTVISNTWSFFLTNLAWLLGILVIWFDLPVLPNASHQRNRPAI